MNEIVLLHNKWNEITAWKFENGSIWRLDPYHLETRLNLEFVDQDVESWIAWKLKWKKQGFLVFTLD